MRVCAQGRETGTCYSAELFAHRVKFLALCFFQVSKEKTWRQLAGQKCGQVGRGAATLPPPGVPKEGTWGLISADGLRRTCSL